MAYSDWGETQEKMLKASGLITIMIDVLNRCGRKNQKYADGIGPSWQVHDDRSRKNLNRMPSLIPISRRIGKI